MSSRVRKRSLGWRRQDPVGGGPKREIQITEHACSKSAVYLLWTAGSIPARFHHCEGGPSPARSGPLAYLAMICRGREGMPQVTSIAFENRQRPETFVKLVETPLTAVGAVFRGKREP